MLVCASASGCAVQVQVQADTIKTNQVCQAKASQAAPRSSLKAAGLLLLLPLLLLLCSAACRVHGCSQARHSTTLLLLLLHPAATEEAEQFRCSSSSVL
jgi:hypothetical protein